jgi:hypothetical protein
MYVIFRDLIFPKNTDIYHNTVVNELRSNKLVSLFNKG